MTQKYQVKVSMKQAAIVETGIVLKQGDFGMQLEIEVLDFDATGTTPQIVFRKAMGAVESTTITVSGNKYTYTFKGTELDTPGKCFCDLKLKNSTTQRISTASFSFKVVADTLDGLSEEASSYSDTIAQIAESFEKDLDVIRDTSSFFNQQIVPAKTSLMTQYVQGSRTADANIDSVYYELKKCTTVVAIPVLKGDRIYTSGTAEGQEVVIAGSNGAYTGWQSEADYTATSNIKVCVNIRKEGGTQNISPEDITTVINVVDNSSRISVNENDISSIKNNIDELTARNDSDNDVKTLSGFIGRKVVKVSNQQYQEITVFENIALNRDEYYHCLVWFDSPLDVSGYAKLYNSSSTLITNTESFLNKSKVEFLYKPLSNSTGNTLKISFNGTGSYKANVEFYSVWKGESNKNKRSLKAVTFGKDELRNGNTNNEGNASYVSTPVIKMTGTCVYVITDRPNSTNCIYQYQYRMISKELDDGVSDSTSQLAATVTTDNKFYFNNNSCIGMQIAITEYNTSTSTVSNLRVGDFEGYHITIFDYSANNAMERLNTVKKILSGVVFDKSFLRNGSTTNPYNALSVAIPVIKTKTNRIKVYTDRPNRSGHKYTYNFITVISNIDDVGAGSQSDYSDYILWDYDRYEPNTSTMHGVQVALFEKNTTTGEYTALRVDDFTGYNIYVYDIGSQPNLVEGIPVYYEEYLTDRMETIRQRDLDIGNTGDAFVFFTDTHMENKYYSPKIAKYILDNSSVSKIIVGGDLINQPTSKQEAVNQLTDHANTCRITDDVIFLRGNHDTNPYGTGQLTSAEYYSIFNKHIEKYVETDGNNYFYRDNTSQKIRYIFMDTGADGIIDSTQITWIQSVASELTSAWTIVLLAHWAVWFEDYTVMNPTESINDVVEALSGINAKIACIICGHTHIDGVNTTSYSFPIIISTCDANGAQIPGSPSVNRDGLTINEQCVNVFHINTSTKTIYLTRIGGGDINVLETGDYTDNDKVYTYT